ncbi:MAG: L-seryl-tRNA(Sec) selenium transferase [Chloroflexota bacterium]|nr:L-seryl-tRNA(Sec) selenium transferase [Chloroflexota bacterium]
MNDKRDWLRKLPSVDRLLSRDRVQNLIKQYSRQLVVEAIRADLESARRGLLAEQQLDISESALLDRITHDLRRDFQPSLRPVINATGVVIHTNLGRAPLSEAAQAAMSAVAGRYNTLEYDLEAGERGSRLVHAAKLLRALTGAEDAIALNNNAAALILILSALASDREVIISRGQLVEIGGGFRIPAIMQESGAALVEVGTTNRTRIEDYEAAVKEQTAMLLRVHASNFRQLGFVEQPPLSQLVACARQHGILAVDDLGSGTLIDTRKFGLAYEPTIQDSISAGFDLVCFSGDKLLGGPQAGIIVGKAALIARLKRHPLARALRVDKLTYAALIATLQHYLRDEALQQVPIWRMIARRLDEIEACAERWAAQIGGKVVDGRSTVGGGSLPGTDLPTRLLAIAVASPARFSAGLRQADPPVIARVSKSHVLLDPRTVLPEQETDLLRVLSGLAVDKEQEKGSQS